MPSNKFVSVMTKMNMPSVKLVLHDIIFLVCLKTNVSFATYTRKLSDELVPSGACVCPSVNLKLHEK